MQSKVSSEKRLTFIEKSILFNCMGLRYRRIHGRIPGGGKSVQAKHFIYSPGPFLIAMESFRD